MAVANVDIRVLMLRNEMNQAELGKLLGLSQPEVSVMLKRELSREQKRRIREVITESVKAVEARPKKE